MRFTGLDVFPFPITEGIIRNIRSGSGLRTPYLNRGDLANGQPWRLNPYGLASGWPTLGVDETLTLASERRLSGRWALDWRPSDTHHLHVGLDATRTDLSFYTSNLLRTVNLDAFIVHPRSTGVFARDEITTGRFVLVASARYHHMSPGSEFPVTPGRIFTNPAWNVDAAIDDTAYANSVARVFARARGQHHVSPRLLLGYSVSGRTQLRLAFGRQLELPPAATLFAFENSDLSFTSSFATFGRDVAYVQSTQFEVGARHEVSRALAVDVAASRKSHLVGYVNAILPFPDPRNPSDTLHAFALTRAVGDHGLSIDGDLDWRWNPVLSVHATYSLTRIEPGLPPSAVAGSVTGFTNQAVYAVAQLQTMPRTTAAGPAALFGDLGAVATLRLASGIPYTRLVNNGLGIVAPDLAGNGAAEPINRSRLPWTKSLDFRLSKHVRTGGASATLVVDLRNLFAFRNVLAVFAETGTGVNDLFRQRVLAPEFVLLADEAAVNGALLPDGTVDLRIDCATWAKPVDCVALRRVESRFGDGDELYTPGEQAQAFDAFYEAFFGSWRFNGPGRTLRIGLELELRPRVR